MSPIVIGSFAALDAAVITQLGYALHQLQHPHGDAGDDQDEPARRPATRENPERRSRNAASG